MAGISSLRAALNGVYRPPGLASPSRVNRQASKISGMVTSITGSASTLVMATSRGRLSWLSHQMGKVLSDPEVNSISSAIQELGVSQSVVSAAIAQIKADLGTLLFERRARGMSLTHAGHQFLRHAHQIEVAMRNARDALASRPHTVAGRLDIGVASLMVGYYLPFLLDRFRRVFPRIQVQITEDRRDYLEHLLVSGELDVALIVVLQLQNYRALETETILRSGWRVWCPLNRMATEEKIQAADLAEQSLILLQVDGLGDATTALWNAGGTDPNVLIRNSSVEAVRSLVATGAGCSVLPDTLYLSATGGHWR